MRPGTYDMNLYRGDTYAWDFVCYITTGAPSDLTGVTAKAEIRDKRGGTLLTALTCAITLPNKITVKLKTVAWTALTKASAVWDLQLTYADSDASIITIITGNVAITGDVTDTVPITALATTRTVERETIHV
jgi:hypothetical protein